MGKVEQMDPVGHGEWLFLPMPGKAEGIDLGSEGAVVKQIMENVTREYPLLRGQAIAPQVWLEDDPDVFVN